jgi:hypothetical protein
MHSLRRMDVHRLLAQTLQHGALSTSITRPKTAQRFEGRRGCTC